MDPENNKQEEYPSISIKKERDASPHIFTGDNITYYHAKRTKDLNLLLDFLYRRNEGILLLSDNRGVGKSSILFTAIHEATKKF